MEIEKCQINTFHNNLKPGILDYLLNGDVNKAYKQSAEADLVVISHGGLSPDGSSN